MEIKELKNILKEIVASIEKTAPYASAFSGSIKGKQAFASTTSKSISFSDPTKGVTFTAFNGEYFFEKSTNKIDKDNLRKTADALIEEIKSVGIKNNGLEINPGEEIEKDFFVEMEKDPENLDMKEMLDIVTQEKDRISKMSEKIVNAGMRTGYEAKNELFINRNKTLYQEITRWDSIFFSVFRDEMNTSQIWGGTSKNGGYENLRIDNELINKRMIDGEKLLYAERLKPGYYDCIFSPGMAGMFAHEAFGHGTETDVYLKNRAKGQEFMNKQVAALSVNMYDSPALGNEAGSYFFDHEGLFSF